MFARHKIFKDGVYLHSLNFKGRWMGRGGGGLGWAGLGWDIYNFLLSRIENQDD